MTIQQEVTRPRRRRGRRGGAAKAAREVAAVGPQADVVSLLQRRIAAEVRAEIARQMRTEVELAEQMGRNQQWFNRRSTGAVPFSAAELQMIAGLLEVPVAQFFVPNQPGPAPVSTEDRATPSYAGAVRQLRPVPAGETEHHRHEQVAA